MTSLLDDIIAERSSGPRQSQEPEPEVASPFLPGTNLQYAWDSTSIGLLKTCPRLYQLTIIEGWTSKNESVHLRFGTEYHLALQQYDVSRSNGVQHEDAIHDVIAQLMERTFGWEPDRDSKAGRYKNRGTLIQLVIDYLDHFVEDPAQTFTNQEGKPAVELSFQFPLDWGPAESYEWIDNDSLEKGHEIKQSYLLCGHLDRVVSFNDQLMVMDRKTTTTTLGGYYFNQWEPNNQMSLYTLAGKVVLNAPIRGVIIDAAQVMLDESNRFVRGFTYRTQDQLDEWLNDLALLLRTNEAYASASYWPQNDTSCDKFGGCKFRSICSKSPAVRPNFLKADFIQLQESERWNPLKPR